MSRNSSFVRCSVLGPPLPMSDMLQFMSASLHVLFGSLSLCSFLLKAALYWASQCVYQTLCKSCQHVCICLFESLSLCSICTCKLCAMGCFGLGTLLPVPHILQSSVNAHSSKKLVLLCVLQKFHMQSCIMWTALQLESPPLLPHPVSVLRSLHMPLKGGVCAGI